MSGQLPDDIRECVDKAREVMTVVTDEDGDDYEAARLVKNARFKRSPLLIAFCREPEHVQFWFECASECASLQKTPFVVRSGGHQHEGRCVDDGAVVLDMSEMNQIGEICTETDTVWIDSGARLGDVTNTLSAAGYVLPVGVCGTVCAGGLTHGGGWGLSWRTFGLTIDHLVEVDVVTSDGRIRPGVSIDNDSELFWAIRGGGGGNFGVVTRLRFKLCRVDELASFTLHWKREALEDVTGAWIAMMDGDDRRINSFCRLSIVAGDDGETPAVLVAGNFYGPADKCEEALAALWKDHEPSYKCIREERTADQAARLFSGGSHDDRLRYDSGEPLPPQAFALQVGAPGEQGPASTCEGSAERHKVSSAFAKPSCDEALITQVAGYLKKPGLDGTNLYVSFHGMGGKGREEPEGGTAYPWREKSYMLQIQAWWNADRDDKPRLDWVDGFKESIDGLTEGAFISFPDEAQKLRTYYGESWGLLRQYKRIYDPANRLRFAMSIPPSPPLDTP